MQISTNAIASRYSSIHLTSFHRPDVYFQEDATYTQAGYNTTRIIARKVGNINRFSEELTNFFSCVRIVNSFLDNTPALAYTNKRNHHTGRWEIMTARGNGDRRSAKACSLKDDPDPHLCGSEGFPCPAKVNRA